MVKTIIRLALAQDHAAIRELGNNTPELRVRDAAFASDAELEHAINSRRGIFYVAILEEQVVGFAFGQLGDQDRPGDTAACLVWLAVAPDMRRQGLGARLLELVTSDLRLLGAKSFYAWAHLGAGDGGIIGFLEKLGFTKGHSFVWMVEG